MPRRAARVPHVRRLRHPRRQALPRADGRGSERQDARQLLRSLQAPPARLHAAGHGRSRPLARRAREALRQALSQTRNYTSSTPHRREAPLRRAGAAPPSTRLRLRARLSCMATIRKALCLLLVCFAGTSGPVPAAVPADAASLHAWESGDDPLSLERWVHAHLQRADADIARVVAVKGTHTVSNTLRPYDDAVNELALAANVALSLNQPVYRALAALPAAADAATRHYLERTLLEYRLAGVDRDDATREKVKALQDKITELGLAFERAVHDDVRTVVAEQAQLDGLPPDYLAAHPADATGHVKITTDPPDAWPAQKFANNAQLRRDLFLAAEAVGYPSNGDTLRALLTARMELAQLLGFATWADFAMADMMIGSPAHLKEYLQKIDTASREPATREQAALLAFAREREPALTQISAADARYWQEQYRRAKYSFDSQSVRPYFPYAAVERGVIATASRLFHIDIRPVSGVRTWHPSVTSYDVYEGNVRLGRIYLDMHPREGKDKWF